MQVCITKHLTKIVDDRSVNNLDPVRNKIETRHVSGTNYTDVLVTCSLDYGESQDRMHLILRRIQTVCMFLMN